MQQNTCIRCTNAKSINKKFGNKVNEVAQYLNSYHGLASQRGGNNAALCIDCHAVHSILPKDDLASTVSANNVTETCRKCHKDASETFAKSYSHESASQEAKEIEDLVTTIYFWLIVAVIGGSDSAAKDALLLSEHATKVYIIYRGEKIRPEPINLARIEKNKKIEIINNTDVTEI